MERRLWWRASIIGAALMIVLGMAPLVYIMWLGSGYRLEPLSMPLSLSPGEYTSPFFRTDLDDDYQIQLYFLPYGRTPLDLDWKIVDAHGNVLENGSYQDQQTGGNSVNLGHYRPKRGLSQRAVVNVHKGESVPDSDVRLHIGLPEESLGIIYGSAAAGLWCLIVSGIGAIVLLVLLIRARVSQALPG
jgi:hypothetical protein